MRDGGETSQGANFSCRAQYRNSADLSNQQRADENVEEEDGEAWLTIEDDGPEWDTITRHCHSASQPAIKSISEIFEWQTVWIMVCCGNWTTARRTHGLDFEWWKLAGMMTGWSCLTAELLPFIESVEQFVWLYDQNNYWIGGGVATNKTRQLSGL